MNDELIDWLREDLDGSTDAPPGLVQRAVVQGRRRRHRRRVATGVLSGAVVAAAVVGAVAMGGSFGGQAVPVPAASPTTVTSAPVPSSATETPSTDPTGLTPADADPASVEVVLRDLLPKSFTVSDVSREESTSGPSVERGAAMTLTDDQGRGLLGAYVGTDASEVPGLCGESVVKCTTRTVERGTLYTMVDVSGEKTQSNTSYYLVLPDDRYIYLFQRNTVDGGNGPITRPELPLTDAEAQALVTSADWDGILY